MGAVAAVPTCFEGDVLAHVRKASSWVEGDVLADVTSCWVPGDLLAEVRKPGGGSALQGEDDKLGLSSRRVKFGSSQDGAVFCGAGDKESGSFAWTGVAPTAPSAPKCGVGAGEKHRFCGGGGRKCGLLPVPAEHPNDSMHDSESRSTLGKPRAYAAEVLVAASDRRGLAKRPAGVYSVGVQAEHPNDSVHDGVPPPTMHTSRVATSEVFSAASDRNVVAKRPVEVMPVGRPAVQAEHPTDSAGDSESPSTMDTSGVPEVLGAPCDRSAGSKKGVEVFSVTLDRRCGARGLGLDLAVCNQGRALVVKRITDGLAKEYNNSKKGTPIRVGDYVYEINGAKDHSFAMLDQFRIAAKLDILFGRPPK